MALFLVSDDAAGVQLDGGKDAVDSRADGNGDGAARRDVGDSGGVAGQHFKLGGVVDAVDADKFAGDFAGAGDELAAGAAVGDSGIRETYYSVSSVFGFQCSVNPSLTSLSSVQ
jgi:hypothetical protein